MQTKDHILLLITAKINGTASPQQLEQLQSWIEAAPGNRKEYEIYVRVWAESGAAINKHPFDTAAAWSKIDPGLKETDRSGVPVRLQKRPALLIKQIAIAASLLVLAGTGYYFWSRSFLTHAVAANSHQSVTLPDGSVVALRKGSTIAYKSDFNQTERSVQLEGEAFFQVRHNEGRPFWVLTPKVQVKVTGTSFLVRSGSSREEVMVASGRVEVMNREKKDQMVLVAGQEAVLYGNRLQQLTLTDSNYMAWQTGVLDFRDASFQKVLEDLERYYAVLIKADTRESARVEKMTITVRFKNQPLEQVLDELMLITGLQTRREGDAIIFYEK